MQCLLRIFDAKFLKEGQMLQIQELFCFANQLANAGSPLVVENTGAEPSEQNLEGLWPHKTELSANHDFPESNDSINTWWSFSRLPSLPTIAKILLTESLNINQAIYTICFQMSRHIAQKRSCRDGEKAFKFSTIVSWVLWYWWCNPQSRQSVIWGLLDRN